MTKKEKIFRTTKEVVKTAKEEKILLLVGFKDKLMTLMLDRHKLKEEDLELLIKLFK